MREDVPELPGAPGAPDLSEVLRRRLFEQRVVLLSGPLDDQSVTRVAAELMTLDADADEPVTLRVDCSEAALAPALTLMDVVDLMGVPVRALCLGQVGEGAVGVVAVCAHRAALPNTRVVLREPSRGTASPVHVRDVARWAELRADERDRFCRRVAAAVGRTVEEVRDDMTRGRYLGAADAVRYGLLDEVWRPGAEVKRLPEQPGQTMGFRPRR